MKEEEYKNKIKKLKKENKELKEKNIELLYELKEQGEYL
jgi:hypothetical protein